MGVSELTAKVSILFLNTMDSKSIIRQLAEEDIEKLKVQDSRGLLSQFHQNKLEIEAVKNWDKFYKRNENRFFKDRHWTTREFIELMASNHEKTILLEVGCGVGNFFYPLLADGLKFYVHACDFSPRAIDLVKKNDQYDPQTINAFTCDITKDDLNIQENSVNLVSLIFVLSAILPCHLKIVLSKLFKVLSPGGLLLFRDYGLNDMAMIRFGPGSKLSDRLYVRQDGTRAYYFTVDELQLLYEEAGFEVVTNEYITRQTINKKEDINATRIFIQSKCKKPSL